MSFNHWTVRFSPQLFAEATCPHEFAALACESSRTSRGGHRAKSPPPPLPWPPPGVRTWPVRTQRMPPCHPPPPLSPPLPAARQASPAARRETPSRSSVPWQLLRRPTHSAGLRPPLSAALTPGPPGDPHARCSDPHARCSDPHAR
eukprot:4033651-Pyramimonas_sp.AAC.1